jgi:DNA-binding NtrC family response regulator
MHSGSYKLAVRICHITLVLRRRTRVSKRVRSFEILLVADNEAVAQALATTLRRAGHRVTSSTTIAGTVECLMRRGSLVDVIMTSTRLDSSLGYDVIEYGRRFAANARVIVLPQVAAQVEDIARALIQQSVPERLTATRGWN